MFLRKVRTSKGSMLVNGQWAEAQATV